MKISKARNDCFCVNFVPMEKNIPQIFFLLKFYTYCRTVEEIICCGLLLFVASIFLRQDLRGFYILTTDHSQPVTKTLHDAYSCKIFVWKSNFFFASAL